MIAVGLRATFKGPLTQPAVVTARVNELVDATLQDLGLLGVRLVADKTPHGASYAGAGLRGSIYYTLFGQHPSRGVLISHGKAYGDVVEFGRAPGRMPPFDAILWWVKAKTLLEGRAAVAFARYVQRKIGARGYGGFFMFKRTLPAMDAAFTTAKATLAADVARVMGAKR